MSTNMFSMRLLLFCVLALFLSGCGTARNLWDKTSNFYENHIDPKPELDLQRSAGLSRQEKQLAIQFSVMDQQLELLLRSLAPQDTFPPPAWFNEITHRFPWLTAVAAVDTRGKMLAQHPETPLKPIQIAPLLEREWSIIERGLQGFVQNTPLGPELIIAGPFFLNGEWQGLLVAHFDPRSLIGLSPNQEDLVLLAPGKLLWSGLDETATQEIINASWEDILKNRTQGRWSSQTNDFAWISRPIGALQMIYAVTMQ